MAGVLILGLGNTILGDDGAGIHAARRARAMLEEAAPPAPIEVAEAEIAGFALLDLLQDRRVAVIIDAIVDAGQAPGTLLRPEVGELGGAAHLVAGHQIDLPTALRLGRTLGLAMPERVEIVAICAGDVSTVTETCTPPVAAAIDRAARLAVRLALEAQN